MSTANVKLVSFPISDSLLLESVAFVASAPSLIALCFYVTLGTVRRLYSRG